MKKRISLLQLAINIGEVDRNYDHVLRHMEQAMEESPDILVLPETWNTGFYSSPKLLDLADENGERTKAMMSDFAKKHQVNIVAGSVATRIKDDIFNTTYVFDRDGACISEYSKMHGFSPAREQDFFTGGTRIHKFHLDGIPCSSAICYDLRFPELIRMSTLQDVHLFFLPAQWPTVRKTHWEILNRARAIENQMFLCAVNGSGFIKDLEMGGNSLLIDPWGEPLVHLDQEESIATGTIDLSIVEQIRKHINVFNDRKPDLYNIYL